MKPALLLVGHGSDSDEGVAEFLALTERVRALAPEVPVAPGFIELSEPPISAAAADLVAGGAGAVVVVPAVLLAAGHAKTDVPASVALARRAWPGTRFSYGAPLGIHPDLLAIVDERLAAAVPATERARTAVVVVGRGSSDPDANADLHKVARLLWEGRDRPLVEPAFVSITGPRVPEALERCRRLGFERVVVVPYFLCTGVLERRIHEQAAAFAAAHPGMTVSVADYLGVDDRIARLAIARYEEAARGDVRMSCDLCVFRAPMPGFGDRVGRPPAPHHHPADEHTQHHGRQLHDHHGHDGHNGHGDARRRRDGGDSAGSGPGGSDLGGLRAHGDRMVPAGCLDLAVNVHGQAPPPHVRAALLAALDTASAYPGAGMALDAVARRHGRDEGEVLLTAGAAEAFWLLAHGAGARRAVVVQPQFTEPERALRAAGVPVERVSRRPEDGWALDPSVVPRDADLVVLGNPNNPTGALDPAEVVAAVCRPGRLTVVDEAFMDFVPDPAAGLAHRADLPGLVVVRSVTKLWGLAGVRAGYLLGSAPLLRRLDERRQPWPVGAAALAALTVCAGDEAYRRQVAEAVAVERARLAAALRATGGGLTVFDGAANFLLVRVPDGPAVHAGLLARGIAVRPSTFPGLGDDHLRVTVRDAAATAALTNALRDLGDQGRPGHPAPPPAIPGPRPAEPAALAPVPARTEAGG